MMIKVGIVGGTGYTGAELLRCLATHPHVELHVVTSRKEAGMRVSQIYPSLRQHITLSFSSPEKTPLTDCDIVFFATPHGVAMRQAPALVTAGIKVIDLSADFRLQDVATYEKWYKHVHQCPELLKEAAYGLVELNREAIKKAHIVGNPGCYPTTIQLGFSPLLKQGIVETSHLIADCKSGVSGAGRNAETSLLFSEINDSFKAYGASGHRHLPETLEQLNRLTKDNVNLIFTPHLVPIIRGMHSTLYGRLTQENRKIDNTALQAMFEAAYHNEPFIDVLPFGTHPETRSTRASNMLRIALHRPTHHDTIIILVVQDNLVKGAAGQAIQCMNLMFGLNETTGLQHIPIMP